MKLALSALVLRLTPATGTLADDGGVCFVEGVDAARADDVLVMEETLRVMLKA